MRNTIVLLECTFNRAEIYFEVQRVAILLKSVIDTDMVENLGVWNAVTQEVVSSNPRSGTC